jgi:hypothetical protein
MGGIYGRDYQCRDRCSGSVSPRSVLLFACTACNVGGAYELASQSSTPVTVHRPRELTLVPMLLTVNG